MLPIEEILCDLLLNHSCVIIPKFGGFVAKQSSAKIDLERNLVIPPSKHLLFNKHLIANDGLLVNEITTKNKLSFKDSESCVSSFVDEINHQLKASKHYELPKIGVFHLDAEGNINFEQDRYFNFLLNAYGLTSVQFVSKQQAEKTEVEIEKETPVIPISAGKRNLWKYAAAACVLPLAFYSIWIPTRTNVLESGLISHKDFNPFYNQETGTYKKKPLEFSKEIQAKSFDEKISQHPDSYFADFKIDDERILKVRMNHKIKSVQNSIENLEPIVTENPSEIQISNNSKKYEYVLGCFANPSNATNFYNKLKASGLDVYKSAAGSLIRITIGATNDLDSLQEAISKANNLGYQGWILKN